MSDNANQDLQSRLNKLTTFVDETLGEYCTGFVFIGTVEMPDSEPTIVFRFKGGRVHAVGLAETFKLHVAAEIQKEVVDDVE